MVLTKKQFVKMQKEIGGTERIEGKRMILTVTKIPNRNIVWLTQRDLISEEVETIVLNKAQSKKLKRLL